jgi:hypothetical protein
VLRTEVPISGPEFHSKLPIDSALASLFNSSAVLLCQPNLDIEIQSELPRMGTEADGVDLMLSLVLQPGLDHVLGKHVAL